MLTKKILLEYQKQNPSKYAHKFGHIDLSKYANEDDVITEPRATTNLDGTPAMPKQLDNQPNMAGIGTNHPTYGGEVKPATVGVATPVVEEKPIETVTEKPVETAPVLDETVKDETTVSGGDANGGTTLNEK